MHFYLKWRTEIEEADLFKVMQTYWRVFHGRNLYRNEQIFLLQRNIKKRLPKRILPSRIWFYGVTKKKFDLIQERMKKKKDFLSSY